MRPLSLLFVFMTATPFSAILIFTRTAIGTADTFPSAFFRFDDIKYCPADNECNHDDGYNFTGPHTFSPFTP